MNAVQLIEPSKLKIAGTMNGGQADENRTVEEWKRYKAAYSAVPGNRVML